MADTTLNDLMAIPRRSRTDPASDQPDSGSPSVTDLGDVEDIDLIGGSADSDDGLPRERATATDSEVVQWILECRREAYDARRTRMRLNNINRDAYMGIQDFSYKQKGQSTETLPKVTVAAEQFSGFIKKSLIQFGNWFDVTLSPEIKPFITEDQIRKLMKCYFDRMPAGVNKTKNIETVFADAGKSALLESLMVLKIYGRDVEYTKYSIEAGDNIVSFPAGTPQKRLKRERASRWQLCIDLIRTEDYYPDPTGRGLYEIHEFERDYIDVLKMAQAGAYDLELVKQLKDEDFPKPESVQEQRRPQQRGQDRSVTTAKRHRLLITEFWGTILNAKGDIVGENLLATVANRKSLIRKPVDNPLWHNESPFVAEPIIRVPHSVWHKALYDSSSALNFAINEIFNLILDGGIASVWGIKQLRTDLLTDPRQVENGIAQGTTLSIKSETPPDVKVLEQVSTVDSGIMTSGMQVYGMLDREFNQASLTNDIMLGELPQRQVKATEIVQSNQANSVTLNSICLDIETNCMEQTLRKSWLTMLQHFDDLTRDDIVQAIGSKAAILMMGLSEAERFQMFAGTCSFKAKGLSAVLAAAQDFQKLMAFFQAVSQNPVLMQSFVKTYSVDKVLQSLMKNLNLNPDDLVMTPDQQAALPDLLKQLALFAQLTGQIQSPQGGAPPGQPGSAGPGPMMSAPPGGTMQGGGQVSMNAGVNHAIQPLTGLKVTG